MSDIFGSIGTAVFGQLFGRRLEHRRLSSGKYRCALRVLEGNQPGLDQQWSIGKALVSPSTLTFGDRAITIRNVSDSHREPTAGEQWGSLGTEFIVFRASTPLAQLELGIVRGQEEEVIERLQLPKL